MGIQIINLMARLMARLVVLVCMACALMADAEQVDVEAGKLIDLGAGKHDLADLVNHMSHASPGTVSDSKMLSHYVVCADPSCKTTKFLEVPGGPVRNLQKGDDKAAEEEAMIAKSAEPELRRKDKAAMPNEGEPIVGEEQLKTLRTTKYPVASRKEICASFSVARRRRTWGWVSRRRGTYGGPTYSDRGWPAGHGENAQREAIYTNQRRRYCVVRHYDNRRTCPEGSSPILKKLACEDAYRVQGPADTYTRISNETTDTSNVYMGKGCIMYTWTDTLRRRNTVGYGNLRRRYYSSYWRRRSQKLSQLYMNNAPQPTLKTAYTYLHAQMVCEDNALPTAAPTPTAPPIGPR